MGSLAAVVLATVVATPRGTPAGPTPTGLLPELEAIDAVDDRDRPPRLVVAGDSTANAIGTGLQTWAGPSGALQVSVISGPGCALLAGETARYRPGYEFTPDGCDVLLPRAVAEAQRVDADALVVFLGSPQLADWRFPLDPEWRNILEPELGERYQHRLDEMLEAATATGIPVLVADVPPPAWDLDAFGEMLGGGELPGSGEPVINEPARTERLNTLTAEVVAAHDGAELVAYTAGLTGPNGHIPRDARADGLHLSEPQVATAADEWLINVIADAERRVRARIGGAASGVSWPLAEPVA